MQEERESHLPNRNPRNVRRGRKGSVGCASVSVGAARIVEFPNENAFFGSNFAFVSGFRGYTQIMCARAFSQTG